ncbi:peroxidase 55-like [Hibiscus syriacus]|uniref:Peroxidase 55-like n=1 Tax=Hibiscus syriacus TaxID=106335 RepID=A0A6A3AXJ7_HIBSY|nr:peroxidase 55-like [Hibiscus syriacus]
MSLKHTIPSFRRKLLVAMQCCGLKFKSYKGRQHLVDKHKFPTSFDFFKKAHPSKKKRMKNQQKRRVHKKDEEASSKMEVENETIDGLVSAVSKLSTSDSSTSNISFGRRNARGLTFVPRSVQPPRKRSDSTTIGEKRVYSRRR